ncbi:efflux transporter periplasmic adaptor subunit, partial [Acinetobacter baumannii]|nr:efflux transporter periplasmic adaptor subunit [Acinetobacter baumannii]
EVGVIVAQPQSVEQSVELSGRTSAYQISEVRPQTSGVIL